MVAPLFPELSPADYAALRTSIARDGMFDPVIVDQEERVLDGHTRQRIARELKLPCPVHRVECLTEDERLRITLGANLGRRHLTKEQRGMIIDRLRSEYNWSNRVISEALGISEITVRRTAATFVATEPLPKRRGRDGRMQPARRATEAEVARRRQAVADLWTKGYTRDAIVTALDISSGTLQTDAAMMGIDRTKPRTVVRGPAPTIEWREKPTRKRLARMPAPPPPPKASSTPAYMRSVTIETIAMTQQNLFHDNAENRLAHDAADAEKAKDEQWFSQAREALRALHATIELLQRVLDDPEQRRASQASINEMSAPEHRTRLRAV